MTEIEKAIAIYTDNVEQMKLNPEVFKDDLPRLELVLEALREKAEREKGCECCNGDALKYCGIKNSFGSPSIVLFGGTAKPEPEEKFKCCPGCGRKLGEGNG